MLSINRYLRPTDIARANPTLYPYGRPSKIWTKGFTASFDTLNRLNPVSATSVDVYLPKSSAMDIGRVVVIAILREGTTALRVISDGDTLSWLSGSNAAATRTQTFSSDRVRYYICALVSDTRWIIAQE